jgi:hypothetical protein
MKHLNVLLSIALAMSLVLIALAPCAHARAQQKTAPVATTPISRAKEPAQETPRAMIERAAFLEEHERDFEAAAKLYEQAAAAAQAAGDAKTAADAQAARAHVLARLGKEVPPIALTVQVSSDDAIANRIEQLFMELAATDPSQNRYDGILSDLEQFGARVVPLAEQALSGRLALKESAGPIKTSKPARLLANIGGPEAMQALARALDSPDPVIRRDVASAMNADKHRALLEKAARDSSPGVREAAIGHLYQVGDPSLAAIMEPAAKEKVYLAAKWMAAHEPEKLIDLGFDPKADDGLRLLAVRSLREARAVPMDVRLARGMLQMCLSSSDETLRRNMAGEIASLFNGSWQGAPPGFRRELEGMVLDHFSELALQQALQILGKAGGIETFARVSVMYAETLRDLSDGDAQALANCLEMIQPRLAAVDFNALVTSARQWHIPETSDRPGQRYTTVVWSYYRALSSLAKQRLPVEAIIHAWPDLDGSQRERYFFVVTDWIEGCWDASAHRFVPGSVDARMVPIVRACLPQMFNQDKKRPLLITYAADLGDVASVPIMLSLVPRGFGDSARQAIDRLLQLDREQALKAVEAAILLGWENPANPERLSPSDLIALPPADVLGLFERLWPHATLGAASGIVLRMVV